MAKLTAGYWSERWATANTPWDIGYPSPPILDYATQFPKTTRILFPGAGRAHEAIALHRAGYTAVFVCDWVEAAFEHLREVAPEFPEDQLLVSDFFAVASTYELILEQTFLSALPPPRWPDYVRKTHELLSPSGRLAGLLFAQPFSHDGPPYGAYSADYRQLFQSHYKVLQFDFSEKSIAPRKGRELFFELTPLP